MDSLNTQILEGLSDNQIKAVTHELKPLLVIAGPGSGKTRVMAHRIPWIVNNFQINPSQILAVTFTNKSAKEFSQTVENETLRTIIHGVLHCMGYNDCSKEEIHNMRKMEDKFISMFHVKHNPHV